MDGSLRLWESLRVDVRQVDQVLDQQLAELEELAALREDAVDMCAAGPSTSSSSPPPTALPHMMGSSGGGGGGGKVRKTMAMAQHEFDTLHAAIGRNLAHYERQLQAMAESSAGALTAVKHTERFQGLFLEKKRTLQRIDSQFRRRREQLELLPSVAVELRNYADEAGARLLMEEQDAIRHAHGRVLNIVEEATSTHARLQHQRERFEGMGGRLVEIAERVPVIKDLLRRIDSRRRREVVILGSVLSVLFFFTVVFW